MLTPPSLDSKTIRDCLRHNFGLCIQDVEFLPIGADIHAAVYRVLTDDETSFFLKLRRGAVDDLGVGVAFFLRGLGIDAVMAPLLTQANRLWAEEQGFVWTLYPFFDGQNAYHAPLSDEHWMAFGKCLHAMHEATLPESLRHRLPSEQYSAHWRDIVRGFDVQMETANYSDTVATALQSFWMMKREEIRLMVNRTDDLAEALRHSAPQNVLCHADLHPGNVLIGRNNELAIVDWDSPILAPKERDLMFIRGGLGFVRDGTHEETMFYTGYGATQINPSALAYYRYERILVDLAEFGVQVFHVMGSVEDRELALYHVKRQFQLNQVVEVAHRTYAHQS